MNEKFTIEYHFQFYLAKVKLNLSPDSIQYKEMKKAFYACASCMLILFRDDIGAIESEDEAVSVMESLLTQCDTFWKSTTNSHD